MPQYEFDEVRGASIQELNTFGIRGWVAVSATWKEEETLPSGQYVPAGWHCLLQRDFNWSLKVSPSEEA